MKPLYDLGYNEIGDPGLLAAAASQLQAVVFDIRHAPTSRNPGWRKAALEKRVGAAYRHIPALGNRNYKGGPIEIVDLEAGLRQVETELEQRPVILMCACRVRVQCHRLVVAQAFGARSGQATIALDRAVVLEMTGEAGHLRGER